jgi:DNA-binding NtrC family response regulator
LGERARILIVDDDETIRKVLAAILEENGYSVNTAETGKEAIEKSNAVFYNLALIDFRLPDMDGTELLTAMRETTPRMVKIIVTGYPPLQNAMEAVNKNADAYVVKPVNVDNVLATIEKHLKKQQEEKKHSEEKVTEFIEVRIQELEEEKANIHRKPR